MRVHALTAMPDALSPHTDQKRLPMYADRRFYLNITLILAGAASVLAAYAGYGAWIGAISAVTTAVTSWTEFAGFQRKLARYTGALEPCYPSGSWPLLRLPVSLV